MSALSLEKNGRVSSSKRSKHIKAKYFLVKDKYTKGYIDLQYCPTDVMWADVTEVCDVYQRGEAHEATVTRLDQRGRVRGCGNVWPYRLVGGSDALSAERLHTGRIVAGKSALHPDCLEVLHPCQKPLAFSDRIIRASSRPGDLVLEPFGGTLRAAVACERMPEREARRYVCVEPDEDGRGYVPAVLATMGYAEAAVVEQVTLW